MSEPSGWRADVALAIVVLREMAPAIGVLFLVWLLASLVVR